MKRLNKLDMIRKQKAICSSGAIYTTCGLLEISDRQTVAWSVSTIALKLFIVINAFGRSFTKEISFLF